MQNRTSDGGRGGRQALTTSAQLPLSSRGRGSVGRSEASSAAVRLSPRRPSSRRRTGCRATVRRVPGPPAVSRRRSPSPSASRGTRTRALGQRRSDAKDGGSALSSGGTTRSAERGVPVWGAGRLARGVLQLLKTWEAMPPSMTARRSRRHGAARGARLPSTCQV